MRGERLDLTVRDGDAVKLGDVAHCGAHHAGALDAVAVVREGAGTLEDHVTDLRKGLALLATGKRADWTDVAEVGRTTTVDLVAYAGTRVGDGVGVGHCRDVGEAAMGRGAAAGGDVLLVLEAGIAEVDVHVDEARNQVLAAGVDHLGLGRVDGLRDLNNILAVNQDVDYLVEADLRVDGVGSLKQKCHCSLLPAAGTSRPCG